MASKRKLPEFEDEDLQEIHVTNKKHTLDSDEEDSDEYEKDDIQDGDIEGQEEGTAMTHDDVKITPFNMREELQEGHFDKDGTYHLNKSSEIRDSWLENIDWVKIKQNVKPKPAEDSDDLPEVFNEAKSYAELLSHMNPNETVQKTIQRLGKNREKISSAERLRRKKAGIVDEAGEKITKFTELANRILTKTGNMDIYQETTEKIRAKVKNFPTTSQGSQAASESNDACDMYEGKEKDTKEKNETSNGATEKKAETQSKEQQWEFKWNLDDTALHGPFSTQQMHKWSQEKYFKSGVYVRRVGEMTNFYTSNRIDFDLYL